MRCFLFLALCCVFTSPLQAQYRGVAQHSVYLELGGFGGMYSLNYDRLLPTGVVLRAGLTNGTLCSWGGDCNRTAALPLGVSYLWSNPIAIATRNQWVEVGGGLVVGVKGEGSNNGETVDTAPFVALGTLLGLRRQPAGRGVTFRAAFTPMLSIGERGGVPENGLMMSAGLTLGYAFGPR